SDRPMQSPPRSNVTKAGHGKQQESARTATIDFRPESRRQAVVNVSKVLVRTPATSGCRRNGERSMRRRRRAGTSRTSPTPSPAACRPSQREEPPSGGVASGPSGMLCESTLDALDHDRHPADRLARELGLLDATMLVVASI